FPPGRGRARRRPPGRRMRLGAGGGARGAGGGAGRAPRRRPPGAAGPRPPPAPPRPPPRPPGRPPAPGRPSPPPAHSQRPPCPPAQIPFPAAVKQTLTDAVRFPQQVAPDDFDVRMLRWVSVSPNQRQVAYTALGRLYVRDLPNGTPRRVTRSADLELYPAWSPDGRSLVYATWNDSTYGAIRTIRTDGSGGRTITTAPGHYVEPQYSADGARIVYRRIAGDNFRGTLHSRD